VLHPALHDAAQELVTAKLVARRMRKVDQNAGATAEQRAFRTESILKGTLESQMTTP
jgi:hypothetical protein